MESKSDAATQEQNIFAVIDLAVPNNAQTFSHDIINGVCKASLLFQAIRKSKASFAFNTVCSTKSGFASTATTLKALSRSKCTPGVLRPLSIKEDVLCGVLTRLKKWYGTDMQKDVLSGAASKERLFMQLDDQLRLTLPLNNGPTLLIPSDIICFSSAPLEDTGGGSSTEYSSGVERSLRFTLKDCSIESMLWIECDPTKYKALQQARDSLYGIRVSLKECTPWSDADISSSTDDSQKAASEAAYSTFIHGLQATLDQIETQPNPKPNIKTPSSCKPLRLCPGLRSLSLMTLHELTSSTDADEIFEEIMSNERKTFVDEVGRKTSLNACFEPKKMENKESDRRLFHQQFWGEKTDGINQCQVIESARDLNNISAKAQLPDAFVKAKKEQLEVLATGSRVLEEITHQSNLATLNEAANAQALQTGCQNEGCNKDFPKEVASKVPDRDRRFQSTDEDGRFQSTDKEGCQARVQQMKHSGYSAAGLLRTQLPLAVGGVHTVGRPPPSNQNKESFVRRPSKERSKLAIQNAKEQVCKASHTSTKGTHHAFANRPLQPVFARNIAVDPKADARQALDVAERRMASFMNNVRTTLVGLSSSSDQEALRSWYPDWVATLASVEDTALTMIGHLRMCSKLNVRITVKALKAGRKVKQCSSPQSVHREINDTKEQENVFSGKSVLADGDGGPGQDQLVDGTGGGEPKQSIHQKGMPALVGISGNLSVKALPAKMHRHKGHTASSPSSTSGAKRSTSQLSGSKRTTSQLSGDSEGLGESESLLPAEEADQKEAVSRIQLWKLVRERWFKYISDDVYCKYNRLGCWVDKKMRLAEQAYITYLCMQTLYLLDLPVHSQERLIHYTETIREALEEMSFGLAGLEGRHNAVFASHIQPQFCSRIPDIIQRLDKVLRGVITNLDGSPSKRVSGDTQEIVEDSSDSEIQGPAAVKPVHIRKETSQEGGTGAAAAAAAGDSGISKPGLQQSGSGGAPPSQPLEGMKGTQSGWGVKCKPKGSMSSVCGEVNSGFKDGMLRVAALQGSRWSSRIPGGVKSRPVIKDQAELLKSVLSPSITRETVPAGGEQYYQAQN
ncbi:hypothetical protein CEUSTIGMA_g2098.t1 [Chlamydomonas eustigma]|uniref:Uncharacterized protein n=1 Tax=Chlamydomonas eustigma TaxID=1157962 RepID=A0A250WVU0_9CHLO|nr:hypothetical protein CEUSTIGMA_g2098.t1 [Chlamydomonas eustigma]|eukprot:GAX74650.1 hypothetical protein CEUSTIGMA_g2098.t1 [Chlamydomonas eustigma]